MPDYNYRQPAEVRQALIDGAEVALIDVREEAAFATNHPLFAANLPLSKLELEIFRRVPRLTTPITLYDNGEGLAEQAVKRLQRWGYQDVALLAGGLTGWQRSGGELFQDVNSPSKAFGELVDSERQTPSLSAEEVKALIEGPQPVAVVDARRFDEYQTMNIPGSISVPGGELALRIEGLLPSQQTPVIVNCAGRTRSIIGSQSLRNAGLANPVYALRNGTIGWTLAGLELEHGQQRRYDADFRASAQRVAAVTQLAERAGVAFIDAPTLARWQQQPSRTTYLFDVRSPEEYAAGHLPHSVNAPGGQLVQETDHYASVRGARIVLVADDEIRAPIAASWLAQMGWEVAVLRDVRVEQLSERGLPPASVPPAPQVEEIAPLQLAEQLREPGTVVLDFTTSANYVARHIPGAWWLARSQLRQALELIPPAKRYVVTCGSSLLARYAVPEVAALTGKPVQLLSGGTLAWIDAGLALEQGETHLATPRSDRYRRPYEGTDNTAAAMQAYLDWEYGLVEQLARDGTHGFKVL
ncbi:rhodanese homology domain-containing protein [Klebsiella aerogenes]|uniref:rhodanese homology domain-containing protein n=1 Tax=Klebsiella aerogenes TaxID=548 RepID=UPI0007B3F2A0|nr:rhodanese homology domain-containing protein [Klebsiella aerogenes]EKV8808810.1 rhodanese homology domain-containing protein [Klebsiella aerogenes]ELJ2008152.1 rhodanese homology domain-containing protein [Klebsiella aerogenes]KZR00930.1 sulfurtransferase [Klebsiella aerogenes]HDS7215968.1 rhodanese homology domain-containing protein [Klebsiella aerogenes]HDT4317465.1 rhodanese homology domain-containing protein [Klebsiella aerogenes]